MRLEHSRREFSKRSTLFDAAVMRGIQAVRPFYFPAFVLLVCLLPLFIYFYQVFVLKPSRGAWPLYVPLLAKSRYLALAGLVLIVAGGFLGYRKGRWLVPRHYRWLSFISGCMATALLLGLIDAVLKTFSYSVNPSVRYVINNPLGLGRGLLYSLGIGLAIGLVAFPLILVPFIVIWREPHSSAARAMRLAFGIVLLPAGIYFLLLFEMSAYLQPDRTWPDAVRLLAAGLMAGVGLLLILRSMSFTGRRRTMAVRLSIAAILVVMFLAQVIFFDNWLKNEDAVYTRIQRAATSIDEIGATHMTPEVMYELLPSPTSEEMLKVTERRKDESSFKISSMSIITSDGRFLRAIRKPPGVGEFASFPMWSPDGRFIVGTGWSGSTGTATIWSHDLDTGGYAVRALRPEEMQLHPLFTCWQPSGHCFISRIRTVTDTAGELVYQGADFDIRRSSVPERGFVTSLTDAATLAEVRRLAVDGSTYWVSFLDNENILFLRSESRVRHAAQQRRDLVKKNLVDGTETLIVPDSDKVFFSQAAAPCFVRGRKWILTALEEDEYLRPCLVELSTGRVEEVGGLEVPVSPELGRYTSTLAASAAADGEKAIIKVFRRSRRWPHGFLFSCYLWEEGGGGFREYLPGLFVKGDPQFDSTCKRIIFAWAGNWWTGDLPKRSAKQ